MCVKIPPTLPLCGVNWLPARTHTKQTNRMHDNMYTNMLQCVCYVSVCVHVYPVRTPRACSYHTCMSCACIPMCTSIRAATHPDHRPLHELATNMYKRVPANWSAPRHVVAFMSRCMTLCPYARSVILTRTGQTHPARP